MDIDVLISVVTVLITLSIATERLVEIIKGFFPDLNEKSLEPKTEAWRKAKISLLAVGCGIFTAFLASPLLNGIFKNLFPEDNGCRLYFAFLNMGENTPCGLGLTAGGVMLVLALGLLASGGSSLWNSVLEYLLKIKDLKELKVENQRLVNKASMTTLNAENDDG